MIDDKVVHPPGPMQAMANYPGLLIHFFWLFYNTIILFKGYPGIVEISLLFSCNAFTIQAKSFQLRQ
jgi:hypothetical protein